MTRAAKYIAAPMALIVPFRPVTCTSSTAAANSGKGLQEVAKRSLEPARHPGERWPCLSCRGCPSITHLQARGMSTEENLNEPEDDAQGQHFQLEAHALRFRDRARSRRQRKGTETTIARPPFVSSGSWALRPSLTAPAAGPKTRVGVRGSPRAKWLV